MKNISKKSRNSFLMTSTSRPEIFDAPNYNDNLMSKPMVIPFPKRPIGKQTQPHAIVTAVFLSVHSVARRSFKSSIKIRPLVIRIDRLCCGMRVIQYCCSNRNRDFGSEPMFLKTIITRVRKKPFYTRNDGRIIIL